MEGIQNGPLKKRNTSGQKGGASVWGEECGFFDSVTLPFTSFRSRFLETAVPYYPSPDVMLTLSQFSLGAKMLG